MTNYPERGGGSRNGNDKKMKENKLSKLKLVLHKMKDNELSRLLVLLMTMIMMIIIMMMRVSSQPMVMRVRKNLTMMNLMTAMSTRQERFQLRRSYTATFAFGAFSGALQMEYLVLSSSV
jgi:ABC-type multidrug transport system permease subunit